MSVGDKILEELLELECPELELPDEEEDIDYGPAAGHVKVKHIHMYIMCTLKCPSNLLQFLCSWETTAKKCLFENFMNWPRGLMPTDVGLPTNRNVAGMNIPVKGKEINVIILCSICNQSNI